MNEIIEIALLLVFSHFLGDFVFQNQTMADRKSRKYDLEDRLYKKQQHDVSENIRRVLKVPDPFVPTPFVYPMTWFYWMLTHGIVHGVLVYFVVGNLWLGLVEVGLHIVIDMLKTEGYTDIHRDQFLHLCTKIIYMLFIVFGAVL